jgi:hypothetical protein
VHDSNNQTIVPGSGQDMLGDLNSPFLGFGSFDTMTMAN